MKRGLLPRRKLPRPSRNSSGSCPSPSSRPSCVGIGLNDLLLDVWRHAISFVGQSRHFGDVRVTSALPPKTYSHSKGRHVSKVPGSDLMAGSEQIPSNWKSFKLLRSTFREHQTCPSDEVRYYS